MSDYQQTTTQTEVEGPSTPKVGPKGEKLRQFLNKPLWTGLSLTVLGLCLGLLSLVLAATAYQKLNGAAIFLSYFMHPLILFLNLLPPVLFIWLFYFLFRRPWCAYLGAALPVLGLSWGNYFKISLRSDPVLAPDLGLLSEAGGIVGHYTLDFTWIIWLSIACFLLGLVFAILFIPKGKKGWKYRLAGAVVCLALGGLSMPTLYLNQDIYTTKTVNNRFINPWSDVEVFSSKGCIYPFLYSVKDVIPSPPPGYHKAEAAQELALYQDADIPADKKVNVMGIMLEAFCDLTDFPLAAEQPAVAKVYERWHALEEESVHGDLLTNIFAGGTVDSEWGFITGYTAHNEFRSITDSYAWYFKNQGYQTFGSHPGYNWFYNRLNVNQYLGFDEYWFTEDHYGAIVDPVAAVNDSDHALMGELLAQLQDRVQDGPAFSFSVTYQNHGPYEDTPIVGEAYMTPSATGMSEQSCNIWNHYLHGISDTIDAISILRDGLYQMDEPVILVLFGDHKPWGGNGNSAYAELGANFDMSTAEGFYQYYSTPYIIWANPAAREVLGNEFVGEGGDFSPAFLMTKVFDLAGWEGPGFMQMGRKVREITPLVHVRNLYWQDGLTDTLPPEDAAVLNKFLCAQYYRETVVEPKKD